jgi:hypothetical protein
MVPYHGTGYVYRGAYVHTLYSSTYTCTMVHVYQKMVRTYVYVLEYVPWYQWYIACRIHTMVHVYSRYTCTYVGPIPELAFIFLVRF